MSHIFKPVLNIFRSDCQKPFEYGKEYITYSGLSNQLFGIINTIIECIIYNKNVLIFDGFHIACLGGEMVELSKIINFNKMIENISNKYGKKLIFLDRNLIKFEFISAEYGIKPLYTIDVTHKILNNNSKYDIKIQNNDYNNILTIDPLIGVSKKLYLKIELNGNEIEIIHDENQNFHYNDNFFKEVLFKNMKPEESFWINKFTVRVFESMFETLVFDSKFYEIVNNLNLEDMNIIHLRAENDMIKDQAEKFYGKDEVKTRELIYNKYRESFNLIPENNKLYYILTSEPELVKIIYGENFKYNIYDYNEKFSTIKNQFGFCGREMCAIVDMIIGFNYSENFLGYFGWVNLRGSTFSYLVSTKCKNKSILIHPIDATRIKYHR